MPTSGYEADTECSYSDFTYLETFNETGPYDYRSLIDDFEDAYVQFEQDAGYILTENLQDRSARAGLRLADWRSKGNPAAQAAEWLSFDYEYAFSPVRSFPFPAKSLFSVLS